MGSAVTGQRVLGGMMLTRGSGTGAQAAPEPNHKWLRRMTAATLVISMVAVGLVPLLPQIVHLVIVPDFTMLWTGGRFGLHSPSLVYDIDAITAAQQGVRESAKDGPLPFIYPPTTLLLVAPFALMPFWPAYIVWTIAGVAAFWTAARRLTSGWVATLSVLSPPAVVVVLLGQTTFLAGAAVLWSVALMRDRPLLSGVVMGVAAAIKPQSAMLGPIAYLFDRNWKALCAAVCTWFLLACASLVFGPRLWLDWFNDLLAFPDILALYDLDRRGATPSMLARYLDLNPTPFLIAGAIVGVALVWVGMKSDDVKTRALAFVGGTILASPYAMNYERLMMAPMLVAAMLATSLAGLVIAIPLVASRVYAIVPSLVVSMALALWTSRRSIAD